MSSKKNTTHLDQDVGREIKKYPNRQLYDTS